MKAQKLIQQYWQSRVKARKLQAQHTKEVNKWMDLKEAILAAGFAKELKKSKDPQTYNGKTNTWENKKVKRK